MPTCIYVWLSLLNMCACTQQSRGLQINPIYSLSRRDLSPQWKNRKPELTRPPQPPPFFFCFFCRITLAMPQSNPSTRFLLTGYFSEQRRRERGKTRDFSPWRGLCSLCSPTPKVQRCQGTVTFYQTKWRVGVFFSVWPDGFYRTLKGWRWQRKYIQQKDLPHGVIC